MCAGDFPNRHENHWVARDGTRRLIAWSNTALRGLDGRVTHIIATGVDITARTRAEAALRASEERFRALSEQASDLVSLLDRDGTIRYASPSHRPLLGYDPADVEGTDAFALMHPTTWSACAGT